MNIEDRARKLAEDIRIAREEKSPCGHLASHMSANGCVSCQTPSPFIGKTARTIAARLAAQHAVCVGNYETSGALAVIDCANDLDTCFAGVAQEFYRLIALVPSGADYHVSL